MLKIKEVRAFPIRNDVGGALYREDVNKPSAIKRRDPWTKDAEVAGPMSGYPRFKRMRSSWRYDGPVGCLITAEDGTTGFGTSRYGTPVIGLINEHFAPLLIGEDALATDRLWDMMMRMTSPYGPAGIPSYAISAVDLALWDLKGKAYDAPVYQIAGGAAREKIFCYSTGNDTDWYMELGFKATKLACPYGMFDGLSAITRNEEFVARTRELVGPDVELMLDCWMAFNVEFAVRMAEKLKPYGLRWIEDCLMPENFDNHRTLRSRLPGTTLATGEHWYLPQTFFQAAAAGVADIFQPDICWAGGFTGCQRINHIAEAAGIDVILHAGMNNPYGRHFSFANPNVRWGEYFVGTAPGEPLRGSLIYPALTAPEDGFITISDAPGFGLEHTEQSFQSIMI